MNHKETAQRILHCGYSEIKNPVWRFHGRRSLGLGEEAEARFFIKKLDNDRYCHVAMVYSPFSDELTLGMNLASDPVLYGLSSMYPKLLTRTNPGSVYSALLSMELRPTINKVKKRFPHNLMKPRVKATFVWLNSLLSQ